MRDKTHKLCFSGIIRAPPKKESPSHNKWKICYIKGNEKSKENLFFLYILKDENPESFCCLLRRRRRRRKYYFMSSTFRSRLNEKVFHSATISCWICWSQRLWQSFVLCKKRKFIDLLIVGKSKVISGKSFQLAMRRLQRLFISLIKP